MSNLPVKTPSERAAIDSVLSALTTEYHRTVLAYFDASPAQTASLDKLAEYVAAHQSVGDARLPEQIEARLHHIALPKLEAAGLLTYDARAKTVRCREESAMEESVALVEELME